MSGFTNKYGDVCPPSGSMMFFAGTTSPSGWVLCDGAAYSTQTYSSLYGVIGTRYGGATGTFNVPNLKGAFLKGAAATNTITNTANGSNTATVALTVDNIPTLSVPSLAIPSLSFAGVSVPSLSVPSLSVPSLSVPSLSVPSLSVPSLSIPSHSHIYQDACYVGSGGYQGLGAPGTTYFGSNGNFDSDNGYFFRVADGGEDGSKAYDISTSGVSLTTDGGYVTGTGSTGTGSTGGGITGTGTTGGGVTDSGFSTGTGTTGGSGASFNVATVPYNFEMNYIIKL